MNALCQGTTSVVPKISDQLLLADFSRRHVFRHFRGTGAKARIIAGPIGTTEVVPDTKQTDL